MRIAICTLSTVLLSGCSWLGVGGSSQDAYGYGQGGVYGADCGNGGMYGHQGAYGAGCGSAGGHGQHGGHAHAGYGHGAGAGYGAAGYGQGAGAGYGAAGYGQGAGAGYGAAGYGQGAGAGYGAAGYGQGAGAGYGAAGYGQGGAVSYGGGTGYGVDGGAGFGQGGVVLGGSAPYGSAVGGQYTGGQIVGGQQVLGGQYGTQVAGQTGYAYGTQYVQGAPVYVQRPYPQYYNVPRLRGVGAAMPFGLEFGSGTEFGVAGDLFKGKALSPNTDDFSTSTARVDAPAVAYSDAFKEGVSFGGAATYDVNRNTTLLAQAGYNKMEGQTFQNGTFEPGSYDSSGNFTSSGAQEDVTATMTDLEQYTIEGGVRQYVGNSRSIRPYVGATAGFTHNNDVDLTQSSSGGTLTPFTQNYIEAGWQPTASGVVGAEMAVGNRAAVGVETGIRWRNALDTNVKSDDRWSIPVSLRGRVSF